MSLVNWKNLVPEDTRVVFSSLAIPNECDELDRDVAALQLASGYGIDVEWDNDRRVFVLTLYRHFFENKVLELEETDVNVVVQDVQQWASYYADHRTAVPDASSGTVQSDVHALAFT